MEKNNIEEHIDELVKSKTKYAWLFLIISAIIGGISGLSTSYLSQKGENRATKQDIEEITFKVENVKKDIERSQSLESEKRALKYSAILSALSLIDANFSHSLTKNVPKAPIKQYSTTVEARECHNRLILTVDNPKVIQVFLEIFFPDKEDNTPPTEKLNEFRNLARQELGYGKPLELNRDKAWFARVGFEKK